MTKMMRSKWGKLAIRFKLIIIFSFTLITLFLVNIIVAINMNKIMVKTNEVYISNMKLNQLEEALEQIQINMTDYLNTKSSDALQGYYTSQQEYRIMLEELNTYIVDDELLIRERNIKNMSESYLEITHETMQAKRGRNIQKYKQSYEEATELFTYINTYIYALNKEQFKLNSNNYSVFLAYFNSTQVVNNLVLLIVGILNIILVYLFTYNITDPLIKLAKSADEVARGNFDIELVNIRNDDEIGTVSKAFNHMILNMKKYIKQITENLEVEKEMKEKELLMLANLKDAQLKYLQAQINPHFLFNTLNAGAQLAMMEEADRTCVFIENMADFFRYNIKEINEDTTLEEELKVIDNYMHILNVRFVGGIHFEKEIDEEFLAIKIPRMILQPIVENAVNYGIREIDWEGRIEIKVYKKEKFIYIHIKDNGIGIEKEKIEKIKNGEICSGEIKDNSNGIGLGNVIKRLKIYFEREDIFEIASEGLNKGTDVIIKVPINMKK